MKVCQQHLEFPASTLPIPVLMALNIIHIAVPWIKPGITRFMGKSLIASSTQVATACPFRKILSAPLTWWFLRRVTKSLSMREVAAAITPGMTVTHTRTESSAVIGQVQQYGRDGFSAGIIKGVLVDKARSKEEAQATGIEQGPSGLQSWFLGPTPSSFWASAQSFQSLILSSRVCGKVVIIVAHDHKSQFGAKKAKNICLLVD